VTLQALAAVMGGTQSLHTNSMDEALWLPTESSVRVALRTQQIIAHESGVADTVDPFGGSYVVECLTDEIEKKANEYIERIDDMGGALQGIENGYIQNQIMQTSYQYQKDLEAEKIKVIGVNAYEVEEELTLDQLKVDPKIEINQREKLKKLRENRDNEKVISLLSKLGALAEDESASLMPTLIECVEAKITLGEICNLLRKKWGEYQAPSWN
jgi:methylmalonyl-CoA mutase N-terminal domain/subunit